MSRWRIFEEQAAAALALLTSTGAGFAQSDTKERAPGRQMQDPNRADGHAR